MNAKRRLIFVLIAVVYILAIIHVCYLCDEVNSQFQLGNDGFAINLAYAGIGMTVAVGLLIGVLTLVLLR